MFYLSYMTKRGAGTTRCYPETQDSKNKIIKALQYLQRNKIYAEVSKGDNYNKALIVGKVEYLEADRRWIWAVDLD